MIHVVLGMHKSGTTLVSEMLHRSGIDMVDEVEPDVGYDEGNKWERESTKAINHSLLGSNGVFSLQATRGDGAAANPDDRARMRAVIRDVGSRHADWGFKDPRTCLTYDLWASELSEHRVIVVYRTAEEGWAHYWRTASSRRRFTVFREFLPRWCEYNAAILAILERTTMPSIVMHYSALMNGDDEFRRLERFIGRPLVDVRQPRMSRSRPARLGMFPVARAFHRLRDGMSPEAVARTLDSHRLGRSGEPDRLSW